jgi:RNA polymerase sigma-70 factor (ECF subfamily)
MQTGKPQAAADAAGAESDLSLARVCTDAQLVARATNGDHVAFAAIMRRHNRLLFRTARSVLKDDNDAEDVVQEAYLRAWRALPTFRAEARLSTWLVRIVVNEALGRVRRQSAQVIALDVALESTDPDTQESMHDQPCQRPEGEAMRAEMRGLIEDRIDKLPEAFRSVFMLRAVEEMSVEEVAIALQLPEATVRTRFFRARGLLREGLSRDVDVAISEAFGFGGARCDRIVAGVLSRLAAAGGSGLPPRSPS